MKILTDEQIDELVADTNMHSVVHLDDFARSIEQAVLQSPEVVAWKRDAERLDWIAIEECQIQFNILPANVVKYRLAWPELGASQTEWFTSPREAIDAAMEVMPS